jgi:hypothetical protein
MTGIIITAIICATLVTICALGKYDRKDKDGKK